MYEIGLGVVFFTAIVLALVTLILIVRMNILASGNVQLTVNGRDPILIAVGGRLIDALAQSGIHLPAGCGGKGTCGQCRIVVRTGGGAILPTELAQVGRREARDGVRLACQVPVKQDIAVSVPDELLSIEQWDCTVISNHNVSTMIKEL
ncbi:MAG: 2Fe-2S iron-sulfur cluster-binding protein, partial [Alphaproteobacteria bacterium]|nr:2Fe-2S iron-sulfur cluster-binding protein [Alphaproteobacteria bacterium]